MGGIGRHWRALLAAFGIAAVLAVPWLPRQVLYACPSGTVHTSCCCGLSTAVRSGCCDVISVAPTAQPMPAAQAPAAPTVVDLPAIALLEWPPIPRAAAQVALPVPRGPPPRQAPAYLLWSSLLT